MVVQILLYGKEKKIVVHFPDGKAETYTVGQSVPGGDLLPGFALDLAWLFER